MRLSDSTLSALVDRALAKEAPLDKLITQAMFGKNKQIWDDAAWQTWYRGVALWDERKAHIFESDEKGTRTRLKWNNAEITTSVDDAWDAVEASGRDAPAKARYSLRDLTQRLGLFNQRHTMYVLQNNMGFHFEGKSDNKKLVAAPCRICQVPHPITDIQNRECNTCRSSSMKQNAA